MGGFCLEYWLGRSLARPTRVVENLLVAHQYTMSSAEITLQHWPLTGLRPLADGKLQPTFKFYSPPYFLRPRGPSSVGTDGACTRLRKRYLSSFLNKGCRDSWHRLRSGAKIVDG